MSGWRNRSYPIRVYVDNELVYEGSTRQSLGYVALPLKPVKGRFVTIQLTGRNIEADAFGGIVEVTGKKEIESPTATARGQLRIVEAEFYE